MSMCQLWQQRDMLHQSVCCRQIQPSASWWWCPWLFPVGANWPDIRWCWSEDQWRILLWYAPDSKATGCNVWDLCRILYLPTMQCSCCCSPSVRDNQPPGTTDTSPAFILPHLWHPTALIWTRLTTKDGDKCSSRSTKFMMSMNWSSAGSMSGMVLSKVSSMT